MRILSICPLGQDIVVNRGPLAALEQQATQIRPHGGVEQYLLRQGHAIQVAKGWDNGLVRRASKLAEADEIVTRVVNAAVDDGILPVVDVSLPLEDQQ